MTATATAPFSAHSPETHERLASPLDGPPRSVFVDTWLPVVGSAPPIWEPNQIPTPVDRVAAYFGSGNDPSITQMVRHQAVEDFRRALDRGEFPGLTTRSSDPDETLFGALHGILSQHDADRQRDAAVHHVTHNADALGSDGLRGAVDAVRHGFGMLTPEATQRVADQASSAVIGWYVSGRGDMAEGVHEAFSSFGSPSSSVLQRDASLARMLARVEAGKPVSAQGRMELQALQARAAAVESGPESDQRMAGIALVAVERTRAQTLEEVPPTVRTILNTVGVKIVDSASTSGTAGDEPASERSMGHRPEDHQPGGAAHIPGFDDGPVVSVDLQDAKGSHGWGRGARTAATVVLAATAATAMGALPAAAQGNGSQEDVATTETVGSLDDIITPPNHADVQAGASGENSGGYSDPEDIRVLEAEGGIPVASGTQGTPSDTAPGDGDIPTPSSNADAQAGVSETGAEEGDRGPAVDDLVLRGGVDATTPGGEHTGTLEIRGEGYDDSAANRPVDDGTPAAEGTQETEPQDTSDEGSDTTVEVDGGGTAEVVTIDGLAPNGQGGRDDSTTQQISTSGGGHQGGRRGESSSSRSQAYREAVREAALSQPPSATESASEYAGRIASEIFPEGTYEANDPDAVSRIVASIDRIVKKDASPEAKQRAAIALLGVMYPGAVSKESIITDAQNLQLAEGAEQTAYKEWADGQRAGILRHISSRRASGNAITPDQAGILTNVMLTAMWQNIPPSERDSIVSGVTTRLEAEARAAEEARVAEEQRIAEEARLAEEQAQRQQEQQNNNGGYDLSWLPPSESTPGFTTNTDIHIEGTEEVLERARYFVTTSEGQAEASRRCSNNRTPQGGCGSRAQGIGGMCARFAAILLNQSSAGYNADQWWRAFESQAHIGDKNIPIGALVFVDENAGNAYYGHVGIYVGDGKIVTNLTDKGIVGVRQIDYFDGPGNRDYLGWLDPNIYLATRR